MVRIYQLDGKLIREWELSRICAGVDPPTVKLDPGYAPETIASYASILIGNLARTVGRLS